MDIDAFHAHLDECEQCRDEPFNLCAEGARLLLEGARNVELDAPAWGGYPLTWGDEG